MPGSNLGLRAAIVSDVHNRNRSEVLKRVSAERPDIILIPGDFFSALNPENKHYAPTKKYPNRPGFAVLRQFAKLAPTYYSLGNHESWVTEENRKAILETGVVLLEDAFTETDFGLLIGGLNSVIIPGDKRHTPPPNTAFLKKFAAQKGNKLLLSHHPEVYDRYIRPLDIPIVISGHAHAGQWMIGSQGIWAPGQGLFPKYTKGIYDKRMVVSPGLANHTFVPRICNPPTLIILTL